MRRPFMEKGDSVRAVGVMGVMVVRSDATVDWESRRGFREKAERSNDGPATVSDATLDLRVLGIETLPSSWNRRTGVGSRDWDFFS
jgi:hypothetical protein